MTLGEFIGKLLDEAIGKIKWETCKKNAKCVRLDGHPDRCAEDVFDSLRLYKPSNVGVDVDPSDN